jgi:soluble lytic murein transglycosylase-like protein
MTHEDTGLRRREDDFKLHPSKCAALYPDKDRRQHALRPRRRAPGRAFLRRFRHPIIGLSLAGAAAPLINTQGRAPTRDSSSTNAARPTEADLARQAAPAPDVPNADAEDIIAAKIAEEHHGARRASVVGGAVDKYNIDEDLAHDIYDVAQEEGIEPKLAYGLVKTESSFRPRVQSNVGARGLTQVMPRTARWLVPGTKPEDLYDRRTNLKLGFRYLNQLIDKYRGDVRLALLAYNRGPGTVDRILKGGGDPNNGYADKVMGG